MNKMYESPRFEVVETLLSAVMQMFAASIAEGDWGDDPMPVD